MKLVRLLLVIVVIFEAVAEPQFKEPQNKKCTQNAEGACTRSEEPKLSRKKRVVTLPNLTSFTIQSRLIVPQPPVGLYLIWIRTRFLIRSMFTETTQS